MQPPLKGEMVLTAKDASGPLGGPIRVPLHLEGPGIYGHREILVHEGTVGGRGTFDTWTVAPADGVVDPSPWWEDQMHPPKSRNVMLTPEKPVDIEVRLDTAVRFPKPGRYAVQLTTVRGKDMLRAEPVLVEVKPAGDLEKRAEALYAKIDSERGEAQSTAFVDLGLLGAPSAIAKGVEHLGHPNQGSRWALVLHLHPDRQAVIQALDTAIAAPDVAVPGPMLEARTALCYNERFTAPILLADRTQAQRHKKALERQVRDEAAKECWEQTAAAVASSVEAKQGTARVQTLASLLRYQVLRDVTPAWSADVARAAGASIAEVEDEKTLRAWLGSPEYTALVDRDALIGPLETMAKEPTLRGDLALQRLQQLVPAKASAVAAGRFANPKPLELDDVAWLLERATPAPADVDLLIDGLDGTDTTRLRLAAHFTQARHAEKWAALYQGLPEDVKTEPLGAVIAGLLNSGHPTGRKALERYGEDHTRLLNEVALEARDVRPLIERAITGLGKDFETSRGAGDLLAEHASASDKARLLALAKRIDGPGEFGASTAVTTARAWTLDIRELNEVGRTFKHTSAIAFAKAQDFRTKPVMVMNALEVHGQPAIRFNSRVYVGEEAILAKLKQLAPTKGVKFGFEGLDALENKPRFEAYAAQAGLPIHAED